LTNLVYIGLAWILIRHGFDVFIRQKVADFEGVRTIIVQLAMTGVS
jgi:hypothetical protein